MNTTVILNGYTTQWRMRLIKLAERIEGDNIPLKSDSDGQNGSLRYSRGVHLAIFSEPFLSLLLNGTKTIESRFSINKREPYLKIFPGDLVFIKKSGGEICGFFIVGKTMFYNEPSKDELESIRRNYEKGICSNEVDNFWQNRQDAKFVSLMEVSCLKKLSPIDIEKRDRTAWVVLKQSTEKNVAALNNICPLS